MKTLTLSLTLLLAALAQTASAQSVHLVPNDGYQSYGVAVLHNDWEASGPVWLTVEVHDTNYNIVALWSQWVYSDYAQLAMPIPDMTQGDWFVMASIEQLQYATPFAPSGWETIDLTTTMVAVEAAPEDDPEMPLDSD